MSTVSLPCLVVGCSSSSSPASPTDAGSDVSSDSTTDAAVGAFAVFSVPSSLDALSTEDGSHFFDHPWPSDFRRDADGTVHLAGIPNPRLSPLIDKYVATMTGKVDGFSPVGAGYLAFTDDLDASTLPQDLKSSAASTSSVQLVDVDDTSPDVGQRTAVRLYFRSAVGTYYTLPHTLAWMPSLGSPLRPHTRYAIVATTALKNPAGVAFAANADLAGVIAGSGSLGGAWKPALDKLEAAGVARAQIAHLSIFTTSDPVGEMVKAADATRALAAPVQTDVAYVSSVATYDRYDGHYSGAPNFQQGTPPYAEDGGGFVDDATGTPKVQNTFTLRFRLILPKASACPMPTAGYPIVLYAHGTGGDYESFDNDGTGGALAAQCLASMGIDQIFHGVRPGAPPPGPNQEGQEELAFFNTDNPVAARTNTRQAAIDEIARAHFVASGGLSIPASVSKTGTTITFDPKRIAFFGHSQGSLNGPLLLATDDNTHGGVLSGAGSTISYSILAKTSPDPSVAAFFKAILGVDPENVDELNELHPILSFLQMLVDPSDAVHYYPHLVRDPFPGRAGKSILMTEGVNPDGSGDTAAPPRTIESGAIAGRFPLLNSVVRDIPELTTLYAVAPMSAPISGNLQSGRATAAIAQFVPPVGHDGHFVVFDVPAAQLLAAKFCKSVVTDAVPIVGGP
ncbi:MAG: hypothetical protein ACHREM_10720 [Polyangiales bacterium]